MGTSLTRPRVTDQLRFVDGPPSISWSPPMIPTAFSGRRCHPEVLKVNLSGPKKSSNWAPMISLYQRSPEKDPHVMSSPVFGHFSSLPYSWWWLMISLPILHLCSFDGSWLWVSPQCRMLFQLPVSSPSQTWFKRNFAGAPLYFGYV